jgi:hypothetical protein
MPRIGSQSVLARLSELMFLDVIRRYLETLPPDRLDWLAGLPDPHIGCALAEIHRDPAHHWTLEEHHGQCHRASESCRLRFGGRIQPCV